MVPYQQGGMTMKAAILEAFGSPLAIRTLPDPALGTGEVIVDVVATGVLPYAAEVFSGERKYLLTLPVAPGSGTSHQKSCRAEMLGRREASLDPT